MFGVSLQDIGVQGYSTLHCIRFRGVEVRMDRNLQQTAGRLGDMPINLRSMSDPNEVGTTRMCITCSSAVHPSLLPPSLLSFAASKPVHHRFYVYCKSPCDALSPGKLRVRCADCKDTSFVLLGVSIYMQCSLHGCWACCGWSL